MGALRALEEHALAGGVLDGRGHVAQIEGQAPGHWQQFVENLLRRHGLLPIKAREQGVFLHQSLFDLVHEQLLVGKVGRADADAGRLVFVAGADAPARGPDLVGTALEIFPRAVDGAVIRHDELGLLADHEPLGADVDAGRGQLVHLQAEHEGVEHHAVADEADFAFVQDA